MDLLTRRHLLAHGYSDRDIRREVEAGSLLRLRGGVFCTPATPSELQIVGHLGGRLACASALRSFGVWTLADARTHVHFTHVTSMSRADVTAHWKTLTSEPTVGSVG